MSTPAAPLAGRTALVLHAHPDDEAIFTAVTIRRLADLGARVVLVTATGGELGGSLQPLRRGESVRSRRLAELERSAEVLGVARLVVLGRRDSGMAGWRSGRHPLALARADVSGLARRVVTLAESESADTLVHDDDRGIYGHPDHVAVHQVGARTAELGGLASYQTTVDGPSVRGIGGHLLDPASRGGSYGQHRDRIDLAIEASPAELTAKHEAMAAHASQIPEPALDPAGFVERYGREWFLRTGRPGLLDDLAAPADLAAVA